MVTRSTYRPGIVEGLYPEKSLLKVAFLDQQLAKLNGFFKCSFKYNKRSLLTLTTAVGQYADELSLLPEHALEEHIKQLKANLLLYGLDDQYTIKAFALIREIAARKLAMRHYEVQIMGGWVMLQGMTAEMETGEGKTLVATLPACTAAMAGIPVHIVTVNDYLVRRDASLMGPIYQAFGLTVGTIVEGMDLNSRQAAYACDICYCTNKQLTFDYLKDRLVLGRKGSRFHLQLEQLYSRQASKSSRLHLRGLCFAIVDEADSVLVDESRTPLILSRESHSLEQLHVYQQALKIVEQLKELRDYHIDHRNRFIELTDSGIQRIKQATASLSGIWRAERLTRELVTQALTAKYLFLKDVHYLVKDGKVIIIDEFTGRVMPDRSWDKGLHQLMETKEECEISSEKETLCRISYQTFFTRYLHLSGMTGTAHEVASELFSVYRQAVIRIPTHKISQRKQLPTQYFASAEKKWCAIVERVSEIHRQGRPILIGTRSVEASEYLAHLLHAKKLPHQILNARQDADEASIIQAAGSRGKITVATNMAGRGTDIMIATDVNDIGGLHVLASECHESRRIDRQLFGRCGRQGNAGSYEMFLSFEDEIVAKYLPPALLKLMQAADMKRTGLGQTFAATAFYWAQTQAERHHALMRKSLLKTDENLHNLLAFSGEFE